MAKRTFEGLTTPYEEKMDKVCPWNEYPRPQLKRNSFLCLNGLWDFKISKEGSPPKEYSEKILVPFPPESRLSGIERSVGKNDRLYYRKHFTIPEGFKKDRILLRFGAVDRLAKLEINGKLAGMHNDGYLPFFADITDLLTDGENEIVLTVTDDLSPIYPYGKQKARRGGMWYTPVSGIWQTVWIESVPKEYIRNIRLEPTASEVKITVDCDSLKKKITLLDSGEVYEFEGSSIVIRPLNPHPWSPEEPNLYRFRLETEYDEVESYFALREVGVVFQDGVARLSLNGRPYLFNGLLDQGYYPDGIFLPATKEGYEDDIRLAKSLGFNTLRKHIKLEPAIFYYLCDLNGICVFQDIINNGRYSFLRDTALPTLGFKRRSDQFINKKEAARGAFIDCMTGTVNTLYNYPSVVYYTIFNEGWGQFCADNMYRKLKSLDSSRIIDSTSGWFWQNKSRVDSYHIYFKKLSVNSDTPRPVVISEFGGYSHRVDGHLYGPKNYGYKQFKSREEFEKEVYSLYEEQVLPLVEECVSALIYTQISDVEDETNGFVTYDRKYVKVSPERMTAIAAMLKAAIKEQPQGGTEQ